MSAENLKDYQKEFVNHLFETGAIKFGQFKLKSGRISPYFVNLAVAMKDGKGASKVADAYVSAIKDLKLEFTYVFGPAYKGIPLSSLISSKLWEKFDLNVRWGYNRKEKKEYGDISEKRIVGDLRDGDTVLIVDDVITTGLTKVESWRILKECKKVEPCGILIAVDRQEMSNKDVKALEEENLRLYSIVKIVDVFEYLYETEKISEELMDSIKKYLSAINFI